jgi:hypothetical protein
MDICGKSVRRLIGRIVSPPADKVVALRHHNDVDIDQ